MEDCRGDANCKQNREKRYQLSVRKLVQNVQTYI